jgi:PhoPQ-activated pathogenicity-related protein
VNGFRIRKLGRFALAFAAAFVIIRPSPSPASELDDYVKRPDSAFAWKQTSNHDTPAGKIHSLDLTSQVWQGITWKHELTIYEPGEIASEDTVLLLITGGRNGGRSGEKDHAAAFGLARAAGARVAVLHQVPNQPLLGDKTEDTLIAETFIRYLETKDANWPLLFPMVKSAVRAMDAVQAWASEKGRPEVKQFVVTGASKRGWTTWLTGAVDRRVAAIAPMVIVMLNMGPQGPNQLDVWGKYSEQIEDYVNRGLMERARTTEGTQLWRMVDPFSFRERLSMPKMLINGANDRYWTLNALDLYWHGLQGPKYLVELPNAGHGLDQNREWAINGLGAFFRNTVSGRPMPKITWTWKTAPGGDSSLTVQASPAPRSARLWSASSPTRDFRESKWSSAPLEAGTTITASVPKPSDRRTAVFAELEYEVDGLPYHLTTTFFEAGLRPLDPTTTPR